MKRILLAILALCLAAPVSAQVATPCSSSIWLGTGAPPIRVLGCRAAVTEDGYSQSVLVDESSARAQESRTNSATCGVDTCQASDAVVGRRNKSHGVHGNVTKSQDNFGAWKGVTQ